MPARRPIIVVCLATLFALSAAQQPSLTLPLIDPAWLSNFNNFVHDNTVIESAQLVNGDPQFTLQFTGMWATFGRRTTIPNNWSAYNGFTVVFENLESRSVRVGARVDYTLNSADPTKRQSGILILPPNGSRKLVLELNPSEANPYSVKGLPPAYGGSFVRLFGSSVVDRRLGYMWLVSLHENFPARVRVSQIKLIQNTVTITGLIDQFGQTSDRTWPNKVTSVTDFSSQLTNELNELNAIPGPSDVYGPAAPAGTVTPGRWNVAELPSGKWYLISPNGRLFWSYGLTTVNYDNGPTLLFGRTQIFQSVPPNSGTTAEHYSMINVPGVGLREAFNFLSYNVSRKFGANWKTSYPSHAYRRLRSWGFNTVSDWAETSIYTNATIPYIFGINTDDYPTRLSPPFRDFRRLPDPFGADFSSWLLQRFTQRLAGHNGRPEFMGVYVDVEPKWYDPANLSTRYQVALASLNAPYGQPAKTALLNRLRLKYRTITRLNANWRTFFPRWSSLNNANILPNPTLTPALTTDLNIFTQEYAYAYFSKVSAALKSAGLTGLYFGARDWFAPIEVVQQENRFVDVFSVAQYENPEDVNWDFTGIDRPVMISEMSFGANDRGAWHPGKSSNDQTDRGNRMIAYFQAALNAPKVVGAHWFQYPDMHPSGRNDTENYNVGFVSISDTPYSELVNAARNIGNNIYGWRGQ